MTVEDPSVMPGEARLAAGRNRAVASLRKTGGVVVALSGGVDSAVLLALALEALGGSRVLAVTARSAAVPDEEVADAARVARRLGARHRVVETAELTRAAYRANGGDRCYHCRTELFETLARVADEHRLPAVAYGAIADDLGDFRPGMEAAAERRVLAPLLEAGLGKGEVRRLARAAGLHVEDKPAAACLASRIPVGVEVTSERLKQVGRAEAVLRRAGLRLFRVRHHGEVARLELGPVDLDRCLADPALRGRLIEGVRAAGFRHVALDLEGYRTGSLNPRPAASALYGIGPKRDRGQ